MSNYLIRDALKFTLGALAISSMIIPTCFSQAQSNQGIDLDQKSINTTLMGSEERKEICSKLKKDFPFRKTMKILGIDSEDYKYYAQYYNVVDSLEKYNGKANQNYNLQLSLYNNCETIPNTIGEMNYFENKEEIKNEDICKKSPLYIEHGIYEENCIFTNTCEKGYEYINEKSTCEKVIKNEIIENINDEENKKIEKIEVNKIEYNQEEINAYQWAKEQGITTMNTINEARLYEPLTRAELAKMISIFAKDILGKEFVIEETINFRDVDSSLGDLEEYVKEAYKLQIMGTGDKDKIDFYPNAYVTRAEFATVLSRLLFGDKFNQDGENRYAQHLYVLKKAKLLDNTKPEELEMKSSVLLMLYKLQGIGVFSNLIPKENPIIDKIEKLGTSTTFEEIEEKDDSNEGTGIKLNYDGVLLHVGFATDDYKQTLVQYAYKLGGMDFVYMIECENGNWDIHAVGDSGHAFGLCQMNDRYHKNIPEDYKTNGIVQVEYCYEKWKGGTKFYGPSRWVKGERCYNYVKNRFSIVG